MRKKAFKKGGAASAIFAVLLCFTTGCQYNQHTEEAATKPMLPQDVSQISELAYDENPSLGYTVYISESGERKPYLVLTNTYNGNSTLLLREYILHDPRRYNNSLYDAAYYNGSEIDTWLNGDFLQSLEIEPIDSIINISAKKALGHTGEETEDIARKVFLLSWGEVGGKGNSVIPASGDPLAYFDNYTKRIAYREDGNGKGCAWFLRSASTWDREVAIGIAADGIAGEAYVTWENGIRPAFCLTPETKVVSKRINDQEEIFVLE